MRARVSETVDSLPLPGDAAYYSYTRAQTFDGSGNVQSRDEYEKDVTGGFTRNDHLYSYYIADDRLTVANRHLGISAVSADGTVGQRGVFETFRYDALGRRVATLSQRGPGCVQSHTECFPYLERTVWDGDQLFYEICASNYRGSSTNDLAAGGSYNAYGRVLYLHGGGIDTPLAVTRLNLNNQPAEVTTAPHADWQGDYVNGTLRSGAIQGNCTGAYTCPVVTWPGGRQTTDGVLLSDAPATTGWWGSLMQGQADASGLRYQRNRFYDPTTGQFTQQDPIGLAGGRNLYAFAGGDPINFRDPFGLMACPDERWQRFTCNSIEAISTFAGSLGGFAAGGGGAALVAVATGGLAVPLVPAAAYAGAASGAAGGLALGKILTDRLYSSSAGGGASGGVGSARGLRVQLADHEKKLADYLRNPDANDNLGLLRNAISPEQRQRIIDGRIRNLQNQINNFRNQIGQVEGGPP